MEPDENLESILNLLAGLTPGLPDHASTTGGLINKHGIGCNCAERYENSTFALRDFCWCQGSLHAELPGSDDFTAAQWEEAMARSGGISTGCPPNFEHFASGITGLWYKHLGRSTEFSRHASAAEALEILRDCLDSLPAAHRYPALPDPRRYSQWNWAKPA